MKIKVEKIKILHFKIEEGVAVTPIRSKKEV